MNSFQTSCLYEFEGFVLDPVQRAVRTLADGQALHLTARAFDALLILVSSHGQLVDKETLIKALWPKVVVEENNLSQVIYTLRQSLGEKPGEHRFIATAAGRGYRFVAPVKEVSRTSTQTAELIAGKETNTAGAKSRPLLLWGAVALMLVAMGSAWWIVGPRYAANSSSIQPASAPKAVAVLPFVNLTGDATKDYLGDGMAEELINTLTKVPGLKVPARTSSFSYKGRTVDARQIARELGVGTIIEGSVRSAGNEIRITAQLINAEDGLHLWSETYDEQFTDIFKLQDKLAVQIAAALHVNLNAGKVATITSKPPTQDVEAYRLYLQGIALLSRPTKSNTEQALDKFQQAIALDAKFARAYEGMAFSYLNRPNDRPEAETSLLAERAAQQALSLDSASASALRVLSLINGRRDHWLDSEMQNRASINLNPDDAFGHLVRAALLSHTGKMRESVQEAQTAYRLAPSNPSLIANLACIMSCSGLDTEARDYAQLAIDLGMPTNHPVLKMVAYTKLMRAGRFREAADTLIGLLNQIDADQTGIANIIRATHPALADSNNRASALSIVRSVRTRSRSIAVNCSTGAYALIVQDELDAAYALADACLDTETDTGFMALTRLWHPEMRSFRQDPRFNAYVSRFGDLMAYWEKYGPPDNCDLKDGKLTCH